MQKLCVKNRIDGVVHLSRVRLIPKGADKLANGCRKEIIQKLLTLTFRHTAVSYTHLSLSKDTIVIKHGEIDMYYGTAQANSLSWINGDVCYSLMDINKNVSKDEMVAMAKDMID